MQRKPSPTPGAREAAQRRLRRLTAGISGAAAGAVAVFALVSAATLPGHATTTTTASTSTAQQTAAPVVTTTTSSTPATAAPHAVSGGS
ncbi:MAG TPA: hypothetical protein VIC57_01295 [Candidatus Dormibacteraeota bacterium]|jgi:hypothetical protein